MPQQLHKYPGTFVHRALCGINTAIWDLLGKAAGQPVYRLLGGLERAEVPMYASSMRRETAPEEEVERFASVIAKHGFKCIKIKIGEMMGRDRTPVPVALSTTSNWPVKPSATRSRSMPTATAATPPPKPSASAASWRSTATSTWEPCPFPDLEATAQVAAALDMPVAGGEQDFDLTQFRRMIDTRAVDIVQPNIGYIGGVSLARKVALMAQFAGIPCTPHCANRSLQMFTLHLAAAMPACYQFHEWSIEESQSWADEIFEPSLEVRGGVVKVPTDPRLGPDHPSRVPRQGRAPGLQAVRRRRRGAIHRTRAPNNAPVRHGRDGSRPSSKFAGQRPSSHTQEFAAMPAHRHLSRRTFVQGGIAASAGVSLAAAGGRSFSARAQDGGKISFMNWDAIEGTPLETAINAFQEQTGIEVEDQAVPSGDEYETKMRTLLASGSPPDIMRINDDYVRGYSLGGQLLDLNPSIQSSELDPASYNEHPYNFPIQPDGQRAPGPSPRSPR